MTQRVPWSVKGITREDRELAKAAAQAAGLSVGAWLTAQIRQATADPAPPARPPTQSQTPAPPSPPAPAPPPTWAARAAADAAEAATPAASRFAFGAGRWQRAAAMPLAAVATAAPASALGGRDPDGRDASGRDTGDGGAGEKPPGRPAQMGADGIEWHDQIAADDPVVEDPAVDDPLAALRGEVAKLRAAHRRDRDQSAQALASVLRRLTEIGGVMTAVEANVTELRRAVDDLARRPAEPAAADGTQIHAALSTTAQAIMRLAARLDHLEIRQPAPGFWRRLFGAAGKPPAKSRGRRTTQRRGRK